MLQVLRNIASNYRGIIPSDARTGTKIAFFWIIFCAILIVWLTVGIPWLTIFYPVLANYAPNLGGIITALIGGATLTFSTTEARKTIENVKNVKREQDEDENPKNPHEA